MLNEFFYKFRCFSIPSELALYRLLASLLTHVGNVPGFEKANLAKTCCAFRYIQSNNNISFQPNFTRVEEGNEDYSEDKISRVKIISGKNTGTFDICKCCAVPIKSTLLSFTEIVKSTDFVFYQLAWQDVKSYWDSNDLFICKKGTKKILCLMWDDRFITPLITSFVNLDGNSIIAFNVLWNFKILDCNYVNQKWKIDLDSLNSLTLADVCDRKCQVTEMDVEMFEAEIGIEITQLIESFNNVIFKYDTSHLYLRTIELKSALTRFCPSTFCISSNWVKFTLIITHFALLFAPLATVLSLPLSLKKNFTYYKNYTLISFIVAFTFCGLYIIRM